MVEQIQIHTSKSKSERVELKGESSNECLISGRMDGGLAGSVRMGVVGGRVGRGGRGGLNMGGGGPRPRDRRS